MEHLPDYIQIPHQLIIDKNLQPTDRILYGVIYWMTKLKNEKCFASNETLTELCGVKSEQGIRASLLRLEKQGYICRIYKDDKRKVRSEIIPLVVYAKVATNIATVATNVATKVATNVAQNKNILNKNNKEELQRLFDKEIQTDNLKEKAKFLSYWTEKNKDGKKERWQKQEVFDIKKRWKTWLDNCKEWGKEEKKKPYYFDDPVVEKYGKKYVINDGEWKLFAGDEKDIVWK